MLFHVCSLSVPGWGDWRVPRGYPGLIQRDPHRIEETDHAKRFDLFGTIIAFMKSPTRTEAETF